jgi:hypothetical protein
MPHALVLVLLVQSTDATDPSTSAAIDAAHRTLGADAQVRVSGYTDLPSDDAVQKLSAGADAVVVVSWTEGHKHVRLRMLRVADGAWVDRDIGFEARDASRERGRTIGFALASMLPEAEDRPLDPAPSGVVGGGRVDKPPVIPAPPSPRVFRGAATAVGLGAVGIGGYGGGFGGSLALEWYLTPWLGLRAVANGRSSDVSPVASTAYLVSGGLGARARLVRKGGFELGARLDALVLWEQLTHLDADDTGPRQKSHLLPAMAGALDLAWYFNEAAGLLIGAGTEVAFGQTDLYLRGQKAATLVPVRPFAELGFRVRF